MRITYDQGIAGFLIVIVLALCAIFTLRFNLPLAICYLSGAIFVFGFDLGCEKKEASA